MTTQDILKTNKLKKIERNEQNFLILLETIRKLNSLSQNEFIKQILEKNWF